MLGSLGCRARNADQGLNEDQQPRLPPFGFLACRGSKAKPSRPQYSPSSAAYSELTWNCPATHLSPSSSSSKSLLLDFCRCFQLFSLFQSIILSFRTFCIPQSFFTSRKPQVSSRSQFPQLRQSKFGSSCNSHTSHCAGPWSSDLSGAYSLSCQ